MIEWRHGAPFSPRFGDVYFSAEAGPEETEHVFLAGNDLASRFARLAPGQTFTLGETGFGTGLNFLATWQLFQIAAPPGAQLDYFSVEGYPLADEELAAVTAAWPAFASFGKQLAARWRRRVPGWNRWHFAAGRVRLTLAWEDVAAALPGLPDASVDAWFLDGFAPAKNPDMWNATVCRELARATRPGGSFATYTAAGWVRRNLAEAGFHVEKRRGFGRKREMLRGVKPGVWQPVPPAAGRVVVIGGGLAGTAAGWALARRGLSVQLVEAAPVLAVGASGNPVGVMHLRLAAGMGPLQRLLLAAWGHALAYLDEVLPVDGEQRAECGLLQLAVSAEERRRIERLSALAWPAHLLVPVTGQEAAAHAGLSVGLAGLWFPQGGWVAPGALCGQLAQGLGLNLAQPVTALAPTLDGWRVETGVDLLNASHVVVASGHTARRFSPLAHLPLQPVRGQITEVAATVASRQQRCVLCGEVYLTPARGDRHLLGATTRFDDCGTDVRLPEQEENLARFARQFPTVYQALGGAAATLVGGRAAVRCSAPGAMPVIGEVAPGLFVSLAHGTRGLLTTGLAAECIAARLTGTLPPLPSTLVAAVTPQRFARLDMPQGVPAVHPRESMP
ncbi:bifunctional tRNA (5-methylaminomethyl-2-thiouridine)(34)-methyltransferase MnmD/FAD-dependent 5-carboxymethylaminomethyl-2-thiouridine(34) oxidoreductase MnmC [Thiobacter aerophilum]|uniref:tRNA 5-methylaminomethyl-2-thiouridine biosynthesis bifunctional protein MnmC n=1 Tax=Thiobacter aerophilum TaxID=3121275 RepID=A0ABV0EET7_9BURK